MEYQAYHRDCLASAMLSSYCTDDISGIESSQWIQES